MCFRQALFLARAVLGYEEVFPYTLGRNYEANPQASAVPSFRNRVSIAARGEDTEEPRRKPSMRAEGAETGGLGRSEARDASCLFVFYDLRCRCRFALQKQHQNRHRTVNDDIGCWRWMILTSTNNRVVRTSTMHLKASISPSPLHDLHLPCTPSYSQVATSKSPSAILRVSKFSVLRCLGVDVSQASVSPEIFKQVPHMRRLLYQPRCGASLVSVRVEMCVGDCWQCVQVWRVSRVA
jgi:hypothetical protein